MLKIRLQRVGRKNDPSFRIVVTDSKRGPRAGNNVELLGSYNPRMKGVNVKAERVRHWMSVGAQVSDTVHNLLVSEKIIEGKKINVLPKKSPIKKEGGETTAPAEATATESATPVAEAETPAEETPAPTEEVKETEETETPADTEEAPKEDTKTEEPKEEAKETEAPKEEAPTEEPKETEVPTEEEKKEV